MASDQCPTNPERDNGQQTVERETRSRSPGFAAIVGSALLALGFLLLITRVRLPTTVPSPADRQTSPLPRQQVVIVIIDTADYFDAHGEYVRSVVLRHCPRCTVQFVNLHGDLSPPTLIQALQQVHEASKQHDATTTTLVNLSLGTYAPDRDLHRMVRTLDAAGVLLIASAGNDNTAKPFYPAAFPEVLAVCSTTRHTRTKTAYSNFGPWIGLCAPGLQYVTRPLEQGGLASGTSFASPMVAGVLGQILLVAPCASPKLAVRALLRTTDAVQDAQQQLGAGLLNAAAAEHFVRRLYGCQGAEGGRRLLVWVQRLGSDILLAIGLVVYVVVSAFTLPLLFAFILEQWQRRSARRLQQVVRQAYIGSASYRCQRLLDLKQHLQRRHALNRRQQTELYALLRALALYGEPCWWCGRVATEPSDSAPQAARESRCYRCRQAVHAWQGGDAEACTFQGP